MTSRSTNLVFCALVAALAATGAPARAQSTIAPAIAGSDDMPWNRGVPREVRQAARELFLEGNRLFRIPLFTQAVARYVAALARWQHPAFYFNLALAQLNLGQELDAHGNLERALQHGELPIGAEQFHEGQKQLREIERHLGRVRIHCATPGAEVSLDGTTLFTGPGGRELWVTAAAHEVIAKHPDYLSEARRISVDPGARSSVELALITLGEASDASRRWQVWKPWTVVAAGVAVAATGGVFHALSARNFGAFDSDFQKQPCAQQAQPQCPDRAPQSPAPADLYTRLDTANRQRTIAVAGYVAGGSLLAAGAVLVYLNRSRLPDQDAASARRHGVAVVPVVSDKQLAVALSARF